MKSLSYSLFAIPLLLISCGPQEHEATSIEEEIRIIEQGLTGAIIIEGEDPFTYTLEERMAFHKVPGVSIAVVKDGVLRWARGYGIAHSKDSTLVTTETLFQAGSISKPIAALGALRLMEEGALDIDANINDYLTDWTVQDNAHTTTEKVTVRRLLTHTAGTTVHGFPGYKPDAEIATIHDVLNGTGNTPDVEVDTIPGARWKYSGGGYTIMEKVVEDISGQPLEQYLAEQVLQPLGMSRSTYEQPLPVSRHGEASAAYDTQGDLIAGDWHVYPEQAAAGLWTTPSDLARYCMAIQEIAQGKEDGVFQKATIDAMLTKHLKDWGLGPSLVWGGDSLRFQHGGKNAGFTNNMVAFAYRGDAYIIMTNADNGGALIREITRSLSDYYEWHVAEPRTVALATLPTERLEYLTGKYKYVEQVPGIGDYFMTVRREGDQLVIHDPNSNETDYVDALDEDSFIDTTDGDEMEFNETSGVTFIWNNAYEFQKVEE